MLVTGLLFVSVAWASVLRAEYESQANTIEQRQGACPEVHIFCARGNDEPAPGRQATLTAAICQRFATCSSEDLEYDNPAAPACNALNLGPKLGISQITDFHNRCPDTHLVISGYSQGGQVIGDLLAGAGGNFAGCQQAYVAPFDPTTGPGSKIIAALLWGDERHNANQPYNVESGSGLDGVFPRRGDQLTTLNRFSNVLRSYCVDTDPICARGNDGHTHTTYFDIYSGDAADFVVNQVSGAGGSPQVPPSSTAAPPAPSSTEPPVVESSTLVSSTVVESSTVVPESSSAAESSATDAPSTTDGTEAAFPTESPMNTPSTPSETTAAPPPPAETSASSAATLTLHSSLSVVSLLFLGALSFF